MPGVFDLAAKLSVHGSKAAVASLKSVKRETKAVRQGFQQMGKIGASTKQALGGIAIIGTGAAIAVGGMAKAAYNFEGQMGAVSSLIGGTTNPAFQDLQNLAQRLGASTSFSATQAAEGIEIMTRAGFTSTEVMDGLGGIMNAAAAEGLSLATATNVVSGVIRAFGRDAKETGDVSDALAYASAKTNTNIAELGEAFKYSGATAKAAKISYQDTAAMLGVLANATLKGSSGGTALSNMLAKMAKPSKSAQKLFAKYKVSLLQTEGAQKGQLKPMADIVNQFMAISKSQPNVLKNMKNMEDMFGKRGARAMFAFIAQTEKNPKVLSGLSQGLQDATKAGRAMSFSQKMAEDRLKTMQGQVTLLKSAMEGFSIATMGQFLKGTTSGVVVIGKFIQATTLFMQTMKSAERNKALESLGLTPKTIKTAKSVAAGIQAGLNDVKKAFTSLYNKVIKPIMGKFNSTGEDGAKSFARMAVKVVAGAAIIGPAMLALAPVIMVLKGSLGALGGTVKLLASPFGKYVAIGMALVQVFGKGKTFSEKLKNSMKSLATTMKPFIDGLTKIAKFLGPGGTLAAIVGGGMALRGAKNLGGGLMRRLAGRDGKLGKLAGGVLGVTGGMGMPVTVQNWHEAGALGGGIGNSLSDSLSGRGGAGFWSKAKGVFGKMGGLLARGGGAVAGVARAGAGHVAASVLAKGGAMAVAKIGVGAIARAVPVAAAAAAGYAVGTWIDKQTGASDKISDFLHKNSTEVMISKMRTAQYTKKMENEGVAAKAAGMLKLSQQFGARKVGTFTAKGGMERKTITRDVAWTLMKDYMARMKFTQEQQVAYMKQVAPVLAKIPTSFTPAQQVGGAKSELKMAQDNLYKIMRTREAEMMKGDVSEKTKQQMAAAQAAVDKSQALVDALSKQVIQITNVTKLDGRVAATVVNKVNRNDSNRAGGRPEGKAAPSKDIKP